MVAGGKSETLSKRQAEEIINSANRINTDCAKQIEKRVKEFVDQVSDIWEDKNAVDFSQKLKEQAEKIVEQLSKNNKTFGETVTDIAKAYFAAGGMGLAIGVAPASILANIDVGKIKEFFGNGENGDDFGFRNVDSGPEEVMTAFNSLKSDVQKIVSEAVQGIGKINAFGNAEVKNNLAQSAGRIVEIVGENIGTTEKDIKSYVQSTADAYKKTGSSSAQAADLRATK